jgi:Tfp pilus assembly protein PilO
MTVRKKIYLTILAFIVAISALVFLVIVPLFNGIKNYALDLSSTKEERALLTAEIKNLAQFKKQFQEYKINLEKADSFLVNSEIPIEFTRFLEKLALDSGVTMEIYPVSSQPAKSGQLAVINYQLSVSGPFLNFSRFLEKLENAPYLIEVQGMNLRKTVENKIEIVNANFTIKVFAK